MSSHLPILLSRADLSYFGADYCKISVSSLQLQAHIQLPILHPLTEAPTPKTS